MSKTLFINACVRKNSRTFKLAKHVLNKLDGEIEECNLQKENISSLNEQLLAKRDALLAGGDYSADLLKYARTFAEADQIVIAAPYWDLTFPALLKTYLENITVSGITFYYKEGIPQGLCKAKKLIYVATAGGPIFANFGFEYVKTLANAFYGIDDVVFFSAENLDIIGADVDDILRDTIQKIDAYFE